MNLVRKCIAEFIGTFAIVFCGCGAIAINQIANDKITHVGIGLTFGLIVMGMIYAMGHISGAHFNPAVTIAFSLVKSFPKKELLPYIFAQLAGACFASFLLKVSLSGLLFKLNPGATLDLGVTQPIEGIYWLALIFEIILTFLLMTVIMGVATDYRAVGNAAGLAIGGTVALEAIFAGPICRASMNPARSFGPALFSMDFKHLSAFIIGPILGACMAAIIYEIMRCYKKEDTGEVKGCC
jgi:aquaporin NIP